MHKDREGTYIGETRRNLQKRQMEHRSAVRRGDENNSIAAHAKNQHQVNWKGAEVLLQEPKYWIRRVLEAKITNLNCRLRLP